MQQMRSPMSIPGRTKRTKKTTDNNNNQSNYLLCWGEKKVDNSIIDCEKKQFNDWKVRGRRRKKTNTKDNNSNNNNNRKQATPRRNKNNKTTKRIIMFGWINDCIEWMITTKFDGKDHGGDGEDIWLEIKKVAGKSCSQIENGNGFLRYKYYDDSLTVDLILAASQVLNLSIDDLLYNFGYYHIEYIKDCGYSNLLECLGSNLYEWLSNLNQLHDHFQASYPKGFIAPIFWIEDTDDANSNTNAINASSSSILVHYYSKRGSLFVPMVHGSLIRLAKEYFDIDIQMTLLQSQDETINISHSTWRITTINPNDSYKLRCNKRIPIIISSSSSSSSSSSHFHHNQHQHQRRRRRHTINLPPTQSSSSNNNNKTSSTLSNILGVDFEDYISDDNDNDDDNAAESSTTTKEEEEEEDIISSSKSKSTKQSNSNSQRKQSKQSKSTSKQQQQRDHIHHIHHIHHIQRVKEFVMRCCYYNEDCELYHSLTLEQYLYLVEYWISNQIEICNEDDDDDTTASTAATLAAEAEASSSSSSSNCNRISNDVNRNHIKKTKQQRKRKKWCYEIWSMSMKKNDDDQKDGGEKNSSSSCSCWPKLSDLPSRLNPANNNNSSSEKGYLYFGGHIPCTNKYPPNNNQTNQLQSYPPKIRLVNKVTNKSIDITLLQNEVNNTTMLYDVLWKNTNTNTTDKSHNNKEIIIVSEFDLHTQQLLLEGKLVLEFRVCRNNDIGNDNDNDNDNNDDNDNSNNNDNNNNNVYHTFSLNDLKTTTTMQLYDLIPKSSSFDYFDFDPILIEIHCNKYINDVGDDEEDL